MGFKPVPELPARCPVPKYLPPMTMFSLPNFFSLQRAALALCCLLPMAPLHAEVREFKSAQGTVLRGQPKKAKGQTILFRTEDGRDLQIDLKSFSSDDQLFILKWMAESPEALDHSFDVKAMEKDVPMTKEEKEMAIKQVMVSKVGRFAPDVSTGRKAYEIALSSTTRASLYDVSVDWCAFMLNKVRTRENLRPGKPGKPAPDAAKSEAVDGDSSDNSKGVLRVKHGSLFIPQIDYAQTETIKTGSFTLNSVATSPRTTDKLVGVWLRFYRGGTLVFEFKSPQCPNTEWPGGAHQAPANPEIASTQDEPAAPARPGKPPAGPKPAPAPKPGMTEEEESIVSIFEIDEKKK